MNKLKKMFIIIMAFLVIGGFVIAYSEYGSPNEFGNLTDTTCWIGGDDGILNCTGPIRGSNFYYSNGTAVGTGTISTGSSYFFNKTVTTYTGDLNGYMNATELCNVEFDGTHFCSFAEIQLTTAIKNVTLIDDWTGEFWIASGPAKYSPASLPCNDCNGFTHGVAGSYLGNWWSSDSNGGIGKTGHCGNSLALACCKNW